MKTCVKQVNTGSFTVSKEIEERARYDYKVFHWSSETGKITVLFESEKEDECYAKLDELRSKNGREHYGIFEVVEEE